MTRIKERLIGKIQESEDLELLEDILSILDESSDEVIRLTTHQKSSVESSLKDINEGRVLSEKDFEDKMNQWSSE
ncbi:hypothetical protein [Marinoscillum sp.]|uniref:hypothetical protein n=1 Tax=Marinoscillum sp. TaxID=2024838 RepID=UPI003BAAF031